MAKIELIFRGAADERGFQVSVNDDVPLVNLKPRMLERLGMPLSDLKAITDLFAESSPTLILYDPHEGIVDVERSAKENGLTNGTLLRYLVQSELAKYSLADIEVVGQHRLSDVSACVTVEWQDLFYPVVLPARVALGETDEQAPLYKIILRQIADMRGQEEMLGEWLGRGWRCLNTRTGQWLDNDGGARQRLSDIRYGDHLKVEQAQTAIGTDEPVTEIELDLDLIDEVILIDEGSEPPPLGPG